MAVLFPISILPVNFPPTHHGDEHERRGTSDGSGGPKLSADVHEHGTLRALHPIDVKPVNVWRGQGIGGEHIRTCESILQVVLTQQQNRHIYSRNS